MKFTHLLIFFTLITFQLKAQDSFVITPGTEFTVTGAAPITVSNLNFVNNGTFNAGNSSFNMTGTSLTTISGTGNTVFHDLRISNTGGVNLNRAVVVNNQLDMAGVLNVKNNTINLGNTAVIINENETNRIIDDVANTGNVFTTRVFAAPLINVNPGTIGVEIVSSTALGSTTIRRYAAAYVKNGSSVGLIRRYYDIAPTNNTALNASVKFYYFDAELNGVDETSAILWKSSNNGLSWIGIVPDTRNITTNYLQKNNVPDFSIWTIGSVESTLPVIISSFNNACKENGANLLWSTTTEINSDKFIIEKSLNGTASWQSIGVILANGAASNYNFTDKEAGLAYYRLKQVDKNGEFTYSKILKSDCEIKSFTIMLYPNPTMGYTELEFTAENASKANLQILDMNGKLIKTIQTEVQKGANKIKVNLLGLASGNYTIKINVSNLIISKPFIKY